MIRKLALSILVAASLTTGAQAQIPSAPVQLADLPLEIRPLEQYFSLIDTSNPAVKLRVILDPAAKRVTVRAIHKTSGTIAFRHETVSFFPLKVIGLDDDSFVVSGVNSRGFSLIEKWDLGPTLVSTVVNPTTGEVTHDVVAPSPTSKDTLFASNQPAQWGVSSICRDRGSASTLLVLFALTKEVYSLDVATGALSLRISSATGGQGYHVSPLMQTVEIADLWSRDHQLLGHVTGIKRGGNNSIVFIDNDSDGVIDAELEITSSLWSSLGLGDGSLYLN